MHAAEHGDVVAVTDDVEARVLLGDTSIDDVVALLDRAEVAAGAPLVDETERARLEGMAAGGLDRGAHWHSVVARRAERAVGYAGLVLPAHDGDGVAHADVAVDREDAPCQPPLRALLAACDVLADRHDAHRLLVWVRHATEPDLRCAAATGYAVDRRLGVLTRSLTEAPLDHVPSSADHTIDGFRDDDADELVALLAAAYEGTPDGGWDRARFDDRRQMPWFDPDDVLVARHVPDGRLLGVHWTKRRGGGVGEVYNLAVHPDAQGMQLGAVLLDAGLVHLRDRGCTTAILWVDLSNERGLRLYTAHGFEVAWEDVALGRELVAGHSSTSRLRSDIGTSL